MKSLQLMLFLLLCGSLNGQITPKFSKGIKFKATSFPTAQFQVEDKNIIIANGAIAVNSKLGWVDIPLEGEPSLENLKNPYKRGKGGEPFVNGGNLYRLYYLKNKKDKTYDEILVRYGLDRKKIDEKTLKKWTVSRKQDIPEQFIKTSRDNRFVECIGVSDKNHGGSDFRLNLKVFNSSMEIITDFDFTPKTEDGQKSYAFGSSIVAKDGTTYILLKKYGKGADESKKLSKKERVANYSFQVLRIETGGSFKLFDLDNEGRFSLSACIYLGNNDTPVVASLRSDKEGYDAHSIGVDLYKMNETKETFEYNGKDFSKTELEKLGFNVEKEKVFPKFTQLTNQFANTDSGLMIYAEELVGTKRRSMPINNFNFKSYNQMATTSETYKQGRGFVIMINDSDFNIEFKCLPKYHESVSYYGSSFFCGYKGNPYLLYLETVRNFNEDPTDYERFKKGKFLKIEKFALGLYYLEDGEWKREMIEGTEGVAYFPKTSLVTDDGILKVAIVDGGKTFKIGSIKNLEINLNNINVASK